MNKELLTTIDLPCSEAPAIDSELGNDNINENVETNDDVGGADDNNNNATIMSGKNEDKNSEGEDSVPNNDNTDSTTNPSNRDSLCMSLLMMADDDKDDDPGDCNGFFTNYDLNNDGVFDNNHTNEGERYI